MSCDEESRNFLEELENKSYIEQVFDLIDDNMSEIEKMRILQINGIKAIPLGRRKKNER